MKSLLQIENEQGSPIPEFLDHGRNHHQPEARRISIEEKRAPAEYATPRTNGIVNAKKSAQPGDRAPFEQSAPEK